MNFVTIREIDKLGRILLPVDVRKFYGINFGTNVTIKATDKEIIISLSEEKTFILKQLIKSDVF